ncbi:MAG: DUF559 domain-containing protein [Pseudomonadota bacterium]
MSPRETRTSFARHLREHQTTAETKLWQALRGSKLDGHKFRRQHPIGRYYADFACEKLMLVVELDGGVHDDDDCALKDQIRQEEIQAAGWSVLRYRNAQVMAHLGDVLAAIQGHAALARP